MSSPCPWCPTNPTFRNQRFGGHIYNNHKKQLLETHEKAINYAIKVKKPYLKLSYKLNGDDIEKWCCFASGISTTTLDWMAKHNKKHKHLGTAHVESLQQLITDKEKIMTPSEPACGAETAKLIKQLEAENKRLKSDLEDTETSYIDSQHSYHQYTAAIKKYNELLVKFYGEHGDGFDALFQAVKDMYSYAYSDDHFDKKSNEYSEEALTEAEENADALAYDFQMYLGDRPKSEEEVLEKHIQATGCSKCY
jgi:hypothetical protein